MLAGGVIGEEEAGGFEHRVHFHLIPAQVDRTALGADADRLAVHHQGAVVDLHRALKAAVGGIVTQHVGDVIDIDQVVDRHHLDALLAHGAAEDQAADAAESINADPDRHGGGAE